MKKLLQSLFVAMLFAFSAMAQQRTITGTVTGKDDGLPLPGVTVVVKGTKVGTMTDATGKYSLSISESVTTIEFSYIGYVAQSRAIGTSGVLNAVLASDANLLGEVVVTAMGQTKQARTLGYANSTIKAADITAANNVNALSGVQGKVAGVSISNSGSVGGSTKVIIRGVSSFTGNQPLYVVDGVPINDNNATTVTSTRTVDLGNQVNDINPDDIESMDILKGASATALYGSRAAHGVVMITTKSAKQNQKLKITYNGAINFSNVLMTTTTQNQFGQGWPNFAFEENGSWGPRLNGLTREWGTEVDGVRQQKAYAYAEDNVRNFYDTGLDHTNEISISGGGEHTSLIFSYGNVGQRGITPGNVDRYKRNNFSLRGTTKYDKFTANFSLNYVRKDANLIFSGQGSADGGKTLFQELIQTPVDINLTSLKDYNNKYNNYDNFYTLYASNPYKVVQDNKAVAQDDRVYGKVDLSYQLAKGLTAVGRLGGDFSSTRLRDYGSVIKYTPGSFSADGGKAPVTGRYGENYRKNDQIDATVMLQGDYKLTDDISLNATAGGNYNQRGYNSLDAFVTGLNVPGWYSLLNTSSAPVLESKDVRRRLFGAFGAFDFSFKDYLYVNVALRNDWSSTLPVNRNSYFYAGANASLIVTDLFKELKSDNVNLLKVRAAYGKTGNDASPYLIYNTYQNGSAPLPNGNLLLPIGGVAGLQHNKRLGNLDLRPEMTTEIEFGGEGRFFNNRLGLDVSYYNRKTKDQIINATLPAETGYTTRTINIGNIQNRGFEIGLTGTPVRSEDFQWNVGVNFTKNISKVLSLFDGVKQYQFYNAYSVDFVAEVGQPLGVYKVPQVERVKSGPDAGKVVVLANGLPKMDLVDKKTVGQSGPDFEVGFSNKFTYKSFSLSALVDWRKGGYFYSYTSQLNNFVGNSTETTFNFRQPFLIPNSVKETGVVNGAMTYAENTNQIAVNNVYAYWGSSSNNSMYEHAVLKRDYIKLREVVFTYSLPKTFVSKLKLQNIDVSLVGRNLLIFTPDSNNFVDPEGSNYGNDITSNFGEFAAGPTVRTIGGSLKVTF
ncbi:SusC/RagA family TonB-linked outer membrane protein [Pedobacter foliorum]|uniref:SusC/RagA family TonB-linked outer membrane protein n=1 Tax=Pedobacter foliorum TaxID=2739058 RepID=UPI001563E3FB|nr:SusC/RagA family TonB-linked outer membrane protein [Pedobacter foliorum]NRF38521.1 SusC/RagA family TonB-linked outer membrane protein [Pedobacter foliorum]